MTPMTQEKLKQVLSYDPVTGHFTWLKWKSRGAKAGARAGTRHCQGYLALTVNRRTFLAHRLAWLYVHGEWPVGQIDHINGVRDDNRIANLRVATQTQNNANMRAHKDNVAGLKGVTWDASKGRYMARIQLNKKAMMLGRFDTPEEAHAAYIKAAEKHFGEFARRG